MTRKQKNFTDIEKKNWIKKLPSSWQNYAILMRLDRPIGIWLLLFPCLFSMVLAVQTTTLEPSIFIFYIFLFALGSIVMRGAGCVMNDLWDRQLDQRVERTAKRPIASGAIKVRHAILFLIFLLLLGFIILLQFNTLTIVLGIASLLLVVLYPLMKRITFWPQAFLGLTFNWGAFLGWSAISGDLSLQTFLLYAACMFWTMAYDTIYAYQDLEDDIKIGIKSTARLFNKKGKEAVGAFYLISLSLLAVSIQSLWVFIPLIAATRLHKSWKIESQKSSLDAFKNNKNIGWCILCAIILNGLSGY